MFVLSSEQVRKRGGVVTHSGLGQDFWQGKGALNRWPLSVTLSRHRPVEGRKKRPTWNWCESWAQEGVNMVDSKRISAGQGGISLGDSTRGLRRISSVSAEGGRSLKPQEV